MANLQKDIKHYLPLLLILITGLLGYFVFSYDNTFRAIVVIATSVSYVTWGIIHHRIHKDLHFSTVLEYLAIGILGTIIAFSIILRA